MFGGCGQCFILSRLRNRLMALVGSAHINRWVHRVVDRLKDRKISLHLRKSNYLVIADLQSSYFYLLYQIFARVQIKFDEGELYSDFRI